jgi:site-specific DNA-cytosine methylase
MQDKNLDDAPIWSDICSFNGKKWFGRVDIIFGGFPCQDISVAGKGAGIKEGTRSGLFFQLLRLVREIRPSYIFLENVSAITRRGFDTVLGCLYEAGYDAKWTTLAASEVGALHRRERWFCLAWDYDRYKQNTLASFPQRQKVTTTGVSDDITDIVGSVGDGGGSGNYHKWEGIKEKWKKLSLPTPLPSDEWTVNLSSSQQKLGSRHSMSLPQVLRLPTMGANEYKGSGKDRFIGSQNFHGAKMSEGLRTCSTDPMYLNPSFAEKIMGYPIGYSDLKPLETQSYQSKDIQHGKCSQTN